MKDAEQPLLDPTRVPLDQNCSRELLFLSSGRQPALTKVGEPRNKPQFAKFRSLKFPVRYVFLPAYDWMHDAGSAYSRQVHSFLNRKYQSTWRYCMNRSAPVFTRLNVAFQPYEKVLRSIVHRMDH
jgi:hypothetical protein